LPAPKVAFGLPLCNPRGSTSSMPYHKPLRPSIGPMYLTVPLPYPACALVRLIRTKQPTRRALALPGENPGEPPPPDSSLANRRLESRMMFDGEENPLSGMLCACGGSQFAPPVEARSSAENCFRLEPTAGHRCVLVVRSSPRLLRPMRLGPCFPWPNGAEPHTGGGELPRPWGYCCVNQGTIQVSATPAARPPCCTAAAVAPARPSSRVQCPVGYPAPSAFRHWIWCACVWVWMQPVCLVVPGTDLRYHRSRRATSGHAIHVRATGAVASCAPRRCALGQT
jgi:hypothetical protein